MAISNKSFKPNISWFWLGVFSIILLSVALRFWGLGRFNTLVFDEVYYAKFANNYLTHTPFFDGHPPLSKYLIALGIWITSYLPIHGETNDLTGSLRTPWSYRWMTALTGSLIPLVVMAIAYQLNHRRTYALIAGLLIAMEGLFLVESRYALNNVYLVLFGLLGQLCLLVALNRTSGRRAGWLVLSGIWFGAATAIKWNGLWFLLGVYLLWAIAIFVKLLRLPLTLPGGNARSTDDSITDVDIPNADPAPLQQLSQLSPLQMLMNLGALPALTYWLIWIPHLQLNPGSGFWALQQQILAYHQNVGNGAQEHPYCSGWYTWFWMIRPVGYFYQTARSITDALPTNQGIPVPPQAVRVLYDVHGMGNPALWWFSTLAIIGLVVVIVQRLSQWLLYSGSTPLSSLVSPTQIANTWLILYLVVNYVANLLPWTRVSRCTFLYHYMGALVFAILAIAWILDQWLFNRYALLGAIAITAIFLILAAFIYWLPLYLGLPLAPEEFHDRMWLRSWY